MSNASSSIIEDQEEEQKPHLLYTKFQRLKNSATKLAKVLIIDETPVKSTSQNTQTQMITRDTTGVSQTQMSVGDTPTIEKD
jgi:hypothetical protein